MMLMLSIRILSMKNNDLFQSFIFINIDLRIGVFDVIQ